MSFETPCNCLSVRQAARQITQLYDAALASTGLRITQYSVLAVLQRLGPSTLQVLADELFMDRSTLGHNLRPLEREGLVTLATDAKDKRARRLELTARGKKKLAAAKPFWQRAQDQFEQRNGAAESKELRRHLRRAAASASE
ncbi:MAG TPA: MarR family winged helix-turn-helix transcriptional regulator [Myxococcales bacterium]|nr:MarR family winged helix-turn-helix transcriptional regulator [Myxococcales bacterium]